MQVPDATANGFLQNRMLSPRHQTVIVASMMALGRGASTRDAPSSSPTPAAPPEDAALLFQQMAELIVGYSTVVAPVGQIAIVHNLPVVTTVKGSAVLLLSIDRLLWTERSAGVTQNLAGTQPRRLEIWMTGDHPARRSRSADARDHASRSGARKQLPLLD